MEATMPAGRPTDYKPEFCEEVIELGKAGKSRAQIASALDCSRQTIANWEAAHPEFLDAMRRANDESLAWWEGEAQTGIAKGSAFNASLWAKSMTGRFPAEPYRERVQLTGANDGPVRHVDLTNLSAEDLEALETVLSRAGGLAQDGEAA
jgi:hypothetical protein